ncbi:phosphodiester glycosidase family protein [Parapedobacter indicus]|uniref:Exopolysaccharide biosynthesis protein n=1 Tax=Parapedobacter indicus TaxID=1477437 RepID=A0A1I3GLT2_9SPHI|nr:phosphodiester glycosidase family protein [Parapedobacter indicus]PPL02701.1 exopolysaccharide biosynthesis protein [Parapedobacter indicus]SFI24370.1 Exopolysaccharide biosynthesis protein [Parapedobacter indicus]
MEKYIYKTYRERVTGLILFLGAFLVPQTAAWGQSLDSLAVVQKEWTVSPIKKGIVWKQGHFDNLFESQQEINLVEIDLRKYRKRILMAADSVQLKTAAQFAAENNALVAINGGFFDMEHGGAWDYIKVANKVVNRTKKATARANAVLLIDRKGVEIHPASSIDYENHKAPNVLLSGPLLIHRESVAELAANAFNVNRHPRSAIAVTSDKKLLLMVVDGRNRMAEGMNLHELARVLRWLGAKDAMNLDGGGSSTLYVKGATENNVVNYPSDNKRFDHEGLREVANIIYLKD